MSWISRQDEYQKLASEVEPSALVVSKDHWIWTALWIAGAILTLSISAWVVSLSSWRNRAATVGPAAGYPETWPYLRKRTVVHEAKHSWQYQMFGWWLFPITWINRSFRAWVGCPMFLLFYFVLPFPVLLCYPRYRLELSADRRGWRWMLENGSTPDEVRKRAVSFGEHVGGKQYGWSWPKFWVMWGFKRAAEKEIAAAAAKAA